MKSTIRHLLALLLLIIANNGLYGQTSRWTETKTAADSSQRIWMRHSLMVDDSVITKMFSARDSMYQQVAALRKNASIAPQEQDNGILVIRKETERAIQAILGEQKYRAYTGKIRERLNRSGKSDLQPLTGSKE